MGDDQPGLTPGSPTADRVGQPHHARRHGRGGVQLDLRRWSSRGSSAASCGSGANDGPVQVSRDGGRRGWNVTPRDLPPAARAEHRGTRPIARARPTSPSTGSCANTPAAVHYVTHDYGKTSHG